MFIIVSYDIPDNRRRTQVMKTLRNFGSHVQYSVFECELNADQYKRLQESLEKIVDKKADNVRFYQLNREDVRKRLVWGDKKEGPKPRDWYLVRNNE
jgi:CRISPR-associated protein Cas2